MTLPWAVGPRRYVADQLLTNADVIRAMREPAQLRHDSQTEFAFIRESLGVSRVYHLPSAWANDPGRGKRSQNLRRSGAGVTGMALCPRFTEFSQEQATQSTGQSCVKDQLMLPAFCPGPQRKASGKGEMIRDAKQPFLEPG